MANKTPFGTLLRPAPPTTHDTEEQTANDPTTGTDSADLDERFREAIQRGDTAGDVVFLDEQGNEIRNALSSKTIFDF